MSGRQGSSRFVLLAAALLGCASERPATEVLVVVDSDLVPTRELSKVQVRIYDRTGTEELQERELALSPMPGPAQFNLPLSYSLTPLGAAREFRLVMTGRGPLGAGGEEIDVVEQQAIAAFRPGARLFLPVHLARSCLRQLCRSPDGRRTDLTCDVDSGACTPVPERELVAAGDGLLGGLDGGTAEVTGRMSGPDGPPAPPPMPAPTTSQVSCLSASDCQATVSAAVPSGCATATCMDGRCVLQVADADRDGHASRVCALPGTVLAPGDDCGDGDPERHPGAWDGPVLASGAPDRCNQRDEDCSGTPDDGRGDGKSCVCDPARDVDVPCASTPEGAPIVWPAGTPVGSCRAGKRTCVDGAWGACVGAVLPADRDTCEPGSDADCDGVPNEGCPCVSGAERPCGASLGACRPGVQVCTGGVWSDDCMGAIPAQPRDTCAPGDDSSCNGVPNEGCECVGGALSTCGQALPGSAACAEKPIVCSNGSWPRADCAEPCNRCPAGACGSGRCVTSGASWSCVCDDGFRGSGTQQCTACPTWYRDCDGDGYAASTVGAVRACSAPAVASGCAAWTSRAPEAGATDCDDASTAHRPGADFALPVRAVGDESYFCWWVNGVATKYPCVATTQPDFNCDGRVDQRGGSVEDGASHSVGSATHPCTTETDCNCWLGTLPCGVAHQTRVTICLPEGSSQPSYPAGGVLPVSCR